MSWLAEIEALKPGDPCEFRSSNEEGWLPATVRRNGGSHYWTVELEDGRRLETWIERVRLPGQEQAWPR